MYTTQHRPAEVVVADCDEFLTADGLTRKAGCTWGQLPTLAIKELVDNSFDYPGATYELDEITGEHVISDEGPGMGREDILRLFNILRPMTSTKRWRRAGRGALGNGLRVACAAVRVLKGHMMIASREGTFSVTFDEIGRTAASLVGPPREIGTQIRVMIGGMKVDQDVIGASTLVCGSIYDGPANAWAFGMMAFRAIARQNDRMTERELAAQFGVEIGRNMPLAEITDEGIKKLHGQLKHHHRNPKNTKLPGMGEDVLAGCYGIASDMVEIGQGGLVPATVEAWIEADRKSGTRADVCGLWMNRTHSFCQPNGAYDDGNIILRGCGLRLQIKAGKAEYLIDLAVTASFFPMTSDGKAPDLGPFSELIKKAVRKAAKEAYEWADAPEPRAKTEKPEKPEKITQVMAIRAVMEDAMAHASDNFTSRMVRKRQLFYAVRALVTVRYGEEFAPAASYFSSDLLPDYQDANDTSHWPPIESDARGSASEPHSGRKNIQLSTSGVSNYTAYLESSEKTYGAVLYIEKEQFGELIEPVQNEFDLLVVEAKGQGTLAEKDLLRWAENSGLPVFVFSDFDVAGLMIFETIKNGSKRSAPVPGAKRVGLTLEQAQALDLMPEPYSPTKQLAWLRNSDLDSETKSFLTSRRFELNHLTTKQMNDLLREELTKAGVKKVMPSHETIMDKLEEYAREKARDILTAELRAKIARMTAERNAEIADQVKAYVDSVMEKTDPEEIHDEIEDLLTDDEFKQGPWTAASLRVLSKHLSTFNL
jgi:hypothetical protein